MKALLCGLLLISVPFFWAKGQTSVYPDTAFIAIKKSLKDALNQKDDQKAAIHYAQIGELFYDQAAYSQALINYYKADALFRKISRTDLLANNLNKIGKTYYYNRQYTVALKIFEEALSCFQNLNNRQGVADSYGFIGQTYEKRDDHKQAFSFQILALNEFKRLDDQQSSISTR